MSTAFERIMRSRGDLTCLHEPFMYDYYVHRSTRVMPHFDVQSEHPVAYADIRKLILGKAEAGPVFFKDMSYYVMPHLMADAPFAGRITHTFLIRDPMAAIVSYAKLDPDVSLTEIGLEAQWQHVEAIQTMTGKTPVIVQSEKVQADPARQMQAYWAATGLSNTPDALVFGGEAPKDWQQVSSWHKDVMASSGIRPWAEEDAAKTRRQFAELMAKTPHFASYLSHHLPFYEKLSALAN